MLKLSIIIPVFNTGKYLEKCLDSLCVRQDLDDALYEVIVINDGSTDNSLMILNQYSEKYTNIRVIDQENAGQSAARNRGIEVARGEYILYIDSDDWIVVDTLKPMLRMLDENQADMLCFEYRNVDENGVEVLKRKWPYTKKLFKFNGYDFFTEIMHRRTLSSTCLYIQNKAFLDSNCMRFVEGIYYEDAEYFYRLMSHAKQILYWDYPVYWYLHRQGSTLRNSALLPKRIESSQKVIESLISFTTTRPLPDKVLYRYRVVISDYASRMINFSIVLKRTAMLERSLGFIRENKISMYPPSFRYGGVRSYLWSCKWRFINLFRIYGFRARMFILGIASRPSIKSQ